MTFLFNFTGLLKRKQNVGISTAESDTQFVPPSYFWYFLTPYILKSRFILSREILKLIFFFNILFIYDHVSLIKHVCCFSMSFTVPRKKKMCNRKLCKQKSAQIQTHYTLSFRHTSWKKCSLLLQCICFCSLLMSSNRPTDWRKFFCVLLFVCSFWLHIFLVTLVNIPVNYTPALAVQTRTSQSTIAVAPEA